MKRNSLKDLPQRWSWPNGLPSSNRVAASSSNWEPSIFSRLEERPSIRSVLRSAVLKASVETDRTTTSSPQPSRVMFGGGLACTTDLASDLARALVDSQTWNLPLFVIFRYTSLAASICAWASQSMISFGLLPTIYAYKIKHKRVRRIFIKTYKSPIDENIENFQDIFVF